MNLKRRTMSSPSEDEYNVPVDYEYKNSTQKSAAVKHLKHQGKIDSGYLRQRSIYRDSKTDLKSDLENSLTSQLQAKKTYKNHKFVRLKHFFSLRLQPTLIAMAFIIFALAIFIEMQALQINSNNKAQVSALSNQANTGGSDSEAVPSQQKPSAAAVNSYQVAPNLPKYLIISKLKIDARILQVNVASSGALGTPPDIYDTAWYSGSATPGEPASDGAVLIDGHVHGPTLPGVFMNIKNLVPGDTIQVIRGDNQTYTYIVDKTNTIPVAQVNMKQLLSSYQTSAQGLNLITCGGPFDAKSWAYTERVEVFASLSQT